MKRYYRIKQQILVHKLPHLLNDFVYHCERRVLWLWWKLDDLGCEGYATFQTHDEAISYIKKRNGIFLIDC